MALTLFRMRTAKRSPASFPPVISIKVEIKPQNFFNFRFNCIPTMV